MDFDVPADWHFIRVKEELDAGRLWKARDRLHGRLVDEPANQDVLQLLGDIHFAMGDLPQAGRYWWMTERDDERADAAAKAFDERFGQRDLDVLRALPRPSLAELYPPTVRARYEALIEAAHEAGVDWKPPVRNRFVDDVDVGPVLNTWKPTWRDRLTSAGTLGFLALLILVFAIYGLITFVSAIVAMVIG